MSDNQLNLTKEELDRIYNAARDIVISMMRIKQEREQINAVCSEYKKLIKPALLKKIAKGLIDQETLEKEKQELSFVEDLIVYVMTNKQDSGEFDE